MFTELTEHEKQFIEKWRKAYKNRFLGYGGVILSFITSCFILTKSYIEKDQIVFLFGYFLLILSILGGICLRESLKFFKVLNKILK